MPLLFIRPEVHRNNLDSVSITQWMLFACQKLLFINLASAEVHLALPPLHWNLVVKQLIAVSVVLILMTYHSKQQLQVRILQAESCPQIVTPQ